MVKVGHAGIANSCRAPAAIPRLFYVTWILPNTCTLCRVEPQTVPRRTTIGTPVLVLTPFHEPIVQNATTRSEDL